MFESRLAWRWKPAFVVLVLALGAPRAPATQVLEMTLSEIVAGADVIAVGTVAAVEQTWDSGTGRPFTQVTLSDIDALKGDVEGGELTLRFLGGAAPGGLAVTVSGTPSVPDARAGGCVRRPKRGRALVARGLDAGSLPGRSRGRRRCACRHHRCRPPVDSR